jgi:retron-type reverse transcriptase
MNTIITNHMTLLWAHRPNPASTIDINNYLNLHNHTIPHDLLPSPPTSDDTKSCIMGSGDSSPGPDGIPFAAYRGILDISTATIHAVLLDMAAGNPPPPGFNHGTLFIIPKDTSGTIEATRPITVNNSDNRIIAKITTIAITPALDYIIHKAQQGFIPGRSGHTHIRNLNSRFYNAIRQRTNHYILLLDTRKAFDSIDHHFIFSILHHINLPQWAINIITLLFIHVLVFPSIATEGDPGIPIHRGVKQGCPLSPIIFALCYDPLLRRLHHHINHQAEPIPDQDPCGFADDLAADSSSITTLTLIFPIINLFQTITGLGINTNKTKIISSQPFTSSDKEAISNSVWPLVNLADEANYLGILMGRKITTSSIFTPILTKLTKRLHSYRTVIHSRPQHQRIIIFNVFLLSLFSYHIQFFLVPFKEIIAKVNSLARTHIINFRGTGMAYVHLTTPSEMAGPKSPLRDLWSANMATLASQADLNQFHDVGYATFTNEPWLNHKNWQSMKIIDHINSAALTFLNNISTKSPTHLIQSSHFDNTSSSSITKARRLIYKEFVVNGWREERMSIHRKYQASLPNRLRKTWSLDGPAATNLHNHGKTIQSFIPSHYRTTQTQITFNALPTDTKMHSAKMDVPIRGPVNHPFPCYLCGIGVDNTLHIFSSCHPVQLAKTKCLSLLHIKPINPRLLPPSSIPSLDSTLTYPVTSGSKKLTNFTIVFNWSTWTYLKRYYHHLTNNDYDTDSVVSNLTSFAISNWNRNAPRKMRYNPPSPLMARWLASAQPEPLAPPD